MTNNDEFTGLDYDPNEEVEFDLDLEDTDDEESTDVDETTDEETETETEPPAEKEDEPNPEDQTQPEKKVQTPEENAMFAQQRREKQFQERFQAELKNTPEYQVAQMLAEMYGTTTEQMIETLREEKLKKEAEAKNVPIELLREQEAQIQRNKQLEQRVSQMEFQSWFNNAQVEKQQLLTQYPMLSESDIDQAMEYTLSTLKRLDVPIKQAVLSLHGEKIITSLQELSKTEALAEIAGRKKGALPPQGGKKETVESLTEDEKEMAKAMGISEKDYLKYK